MSMHTPTPLEVLEYIAASPGLRQSDLAAVFGIDTRRMGDRISVLEEMLMIDRPRRPDGTRPLCLTAAAEAFLGALVAGGKR